MKFRLLFFILSLFIISVFISCSKQEYLKSEKEIKKALQGTWTLIPIPRYDVIDSVQQKHFETWTFNDTKVIIVNGSQTASSTYSVHTSFSKAEFKLDGVEPVFTYPSRVRSINGTWRIVQLDDDVMVISNDQDGNSGLTQLDFVR